MAEHRQRWFRQILQSALEEDIAGPGEILAHVSPEVMATHLPADLMSELLAKSLSAGAMRADHVVSVLTPELLAAHIPHTVIWECVAEAAEEQGMTRPDAGEPSSIGQQRRFLETAIASGLDFGMVSEDEVLADVTLEVLAEHLPTRLKAELLRACLEAERVDAELMVRTVGIGALAEHAPIHRLWRVVDAAGRRAAGIKGARRPDAHPAGERPPEPASNGEADSSRKPNLRVRGAGATSRRSRPTTGVHRAATEPEALDKVLSDIEVVEETDVGINAIDGTE